MAVRALMIGIPASAVALTAGTALAASASPQSPTAVQAHLKSRQIAFGHPVVVTGTVPSADAGHKLDLQYLPTGASRWQTLRSTIPGASGRYRLSARLRRSGFVRVVDASTAPIAPVIGTASASAAASSTQHVAVAAAFRLRPQTLASLGGHAVAVSGQFLPALRGRIIRLQALSGHVWHTVATTGTGAGGRFRLRFVPAGGNQRLRVHFDGDRQNSRSSAPAGSVSSYQPSVASWYNDGGSTACGFHAYYGVANKSLPCGTQVRFSYGGRTVTAVVDDRGPYVGGREWDLNQNTAGALGFGGVGTVWASY